ncbi:MAG: DNA/RNA non-specific endonuclease [Crocinitomicaceae bacterium]|nr:DNA/RNA non-specific endonuclease [Crocinitomicaceae bacterium]
MRKLFFLFALVNSFCFSQQEALTKDGKIVILLDDGTWRYKSSTALVPDVEIPFCNTEEIIRHQAYSLLYSEQHEQASWVAYFLTKNDLVSKTSRTDDFRPDPMIKSGSAEIADYKGSGYDRGHLAPAGDMVRSKQVMSESFYFSNMSPQTPAFNRGIWRLLEENVRNCVNAFDSIYVVTGPVLEDELPTIGTNKVSVPKYYYKIMMRVSREGTPISIGYLMPNEASSRSYTEYAVTVDSIETVTGLDFFPTLNDSIEEVMEKTICASCWNPKKEQYPPVKIQPQGSSVNPNTEGDNK